MVLTTLDVVPGRAIVKHVGLVQGSTVRARRFGPDSPFSGLYDLDSLLGLGGEVSERNLLSMESPEEAVDRMVQQATGIGANAVLNIRFSTALISQGAAEILVYGTAVVLG